MCSRVEVSSHVIDQLMSLRFKTRPKTREQAKKIVEKDIRFSKLIKINPDGSELRAHNGRIYPCIIKNDVIIVKTVLKGNRYVE